MLKQRLTTGWTFIRVLYLAMGILFIIQSVVQQQWFGIFIGGYFSAMGLFSFGCAAGNCFGGSCANESGGEKTTVKNNAVELEEIKGKN